MQVQVHCTEPIYMNVGGMGVRVMVGNWKVGFVGGRGGKVIESVYFSHKMGGQFEKGSWWVRTGARHAPICLGLETAVSNYTTMSHYKNW